MIKRYKKDEAIIIINKTIAFILSIALFLIYTYYPKHLNITYIYLITVSIMIDIILVIRLEKKIRKSNLQNDIWEWKTIKSGVITVAQGYQCPECKVIVGVYPICRKCNGEKK